MRVLSTNIACYHANLQRGNCVNINISLEAYMAMGEPKSVVFSESGFSIHPSTIDTQREYLIHRNNKRALITVLLRYTPPDVLVGTWQWEINDLSIKLTEKIKQQ